MKRNRIAMLFKLGTCGFLIAAATITAYQWGYMQSAIDHHVASFSAPAYVAILSGLPCFVCAIVTAILALFFSKKKE